MNSLRHIGIFVKDLEVMRKFYSDLLGMELIYDETECGEYLKALLGLDTEPSIHILKLKNSGGTIIELLRLDGAEHNRGVTAPGLSHLAVTVHDLDGLHARLSSGGIRFNSPPMTSPYGNVKVCFCRDPEGNSLELVEDFT